LLALMALRSVRFIADFVLLTAPLIAEGLAPQVRALSPRVQRVALVAALALVPAAAGAIATTLPPGRAFGVGANLGSLPVACGELIARELPRARVFAAIDDAWYLEHAARDARFFADGRVPFFGPAHLDALARAFATADELRRTLDASATDLVVLQPTLAPHQTALRALRATAAFQLVMVEDHHAAFARVTQQRAAWLRRAALRALPPGYEPAALLSEGVDVTAVRSDLAKLAAAPNRVAHQAFTSALLDLRPLARAHGRAGFSPPADGTERALVRDALARLRRADELLEVVPTVTAYHALLAAVGCELSEAQQALSRLSADSPTPTTPGFEARVLRTALELG